MLVLCACCTAIEADIPVIVFIGSVLSAIIVIMERIACNSRTAIRTVPGIRAAYRMTEPITGSFTAQRACAPMESAVIICIIIAGLVPEVRAGICFFAYVAYSGIIAFSRMRIVINYFRTVFAGNPVVRIGCFPVIPVVNMVNSQIGIRLTAFTALS